jgi:hypothetical protein
LEIAMDANAHIPHADNAVAQAPAVIEDPQFEQLIQAAHALKARFVDENCHWYRTHKRVPFLAYRLAGVLIIILGVTLPAIVAVEFPRKTLVISVMSVTIAALTGLNSFFRWDRTWRGRALCQYDIEWLVARWELELENARLILPDAHQRRQHVYRATRELLSNVASVSDSEVQEFFGRLQFPQNDQSSKGA